MEKGTLKIIISFLVLQIFLPSGLFSQIEPAAHIRKMVTEVNKAENDSLKIERLSRLAFFYLDYLGDYKSADSIAEVAIQIARQSRRPELLFLAYNKYAESCNLYENYQKAREYVIKAEQISFDRKNSENVFSNYKNIIAVYLSGYEFDKALEYGYKLLSVAGTSENIELKAESYLEIGQCLEGKNQRIEAFRNYLNATTLADKIHSTSLLIECYSRLSHFYNNNKLSSKATHYKLLQQNLIRNAKEVDSVALVWTDYDLQVIDLNSNNNKLNEGDMEKILKFAVRHRHNRMLNYEIAIIRSHCIEANKFVLLRDLYGKKFPGELDKLASENPALYFRLRAFFSEEEKMPDSAFYYFNQAEKKLKAESNIILQSSFYIRFGQFLMRHGYKKQAVEKFLKSLELAKTAFYIDYMLVATKQLEAIYAGEGDYKNAFQYSVLNKVLNDSINNMSKKDQMLIMEIDHETRQRDLAAEKEKQSTSRRYSLQYTAMIIGILTIFVILIMLGSLKVPEWIIRTLGFFSFIFLFEFIILLADHQIHEFTHGEPWKIMLIKIFLIAILLPLHHWIEKKVINYLLSHKLIDMSKLSTLRSLKGYYKKWTDRQHS